MSIDLSSIHNELNQDMLDTSYDITVSHAEADFESSYGTVAVALVGREVDAVTREQILNMLTELTVDDIEYANRTYSG